jgi:hypothetical protein
MEARVRELARRGKAWQTLEDRHAGLRDSEGRSLCVPAAITPAVRPAETALRWRRAEADTDPGS